MNGNMEQSSIGEMTRKGIRKRFDDISALTLVHFLIRAAAVVPLLLSQLLGGRLPTPLAAGACGAIYVLAALPLRFWEGQKLRRIYYSRSQRSKKKNVYAQWLKTGLLRYLRGFLWGIPFLACAAYLIVFRTILDARTFEMPLHWLAMLLAGNPASGEGNVSLALIIIGALIVVFGLLFAYGWWRDMPFEYLPVRSLGPVKTLHWSRRIKKKHGGEMRKVTLVNMLLNLPAVIGFCAVLWLYARNSVNFSLSVSLLFTQLQRLFTQPIPSLVLAELLGVFAVLYLPMWCYRKARCAAFVAKQMKTKNNSAKSKSAIVEKYREAERDAQLEVKKQRIEEWGARLRAEEQKMRAETYSPEAIQTPPATEAARPAADGDQNDHAAG